MTSSTNHPEARYGKGLQFHYSHAALGAVVLGVILATVPAGRAAVAIAGCVAIWFGVYLFMRESVKTIRWFATPMIAVAAWFVLVSVSGSMARWAPAAGAVALSRTEPVQATTSGTDLHADVRLTGAQFIVTNGSAQPWSGVALSLTGTDAATYTTTIDRVEAGRMVVVQLSRFAAADGHRFRTATTKPQALTIEAHPGGGGAGRYTLRWK